MRFSILLSVFLSLATTSFSNRTQFSHDRDLPPLKLAAADLDTILRKTQSLIAAANGPSGEQGFGRESVKLGVRGNEIEIPHFSLVRYAAPIFFLGLIATLLGIPLSYFLPRRRGRLR